MREAACRAHFLRKIFENHQTSPTQLNTDLLERIAWLYRVEDEIRGSPPEARRRQRQERSRPQIQDLRVAIDDALRRRSHKSAMAKALAYGRKRWDALTRHLDEGTAEVDNSAAERAMRAIAIGRKNWPFAGSVAGGERAAAILLRHRDRQAQRHRAASLHHRRHREGRQRLAGRALGRSSWRGTGSQDRRQSSLLREEPAVAGDDTPRRANPNI